MFTHKPSSNETKLIKTKNSYSMNRKFHSQTIFTIVYTLLQKHKT